MPPRAVARPCRLRDAEMVKYAANGLQDFIAISRYARYVPEKRRRETWAEAVTDSTRLERGQHGRPGLPGGAGPMERDQRLAGPAAVGMWMVVAGQVAWLAWEAWARGAIS